MECGNSKVSMSNRLQSGSNSRVSVELSCLIGIGIAIEIGIGREQLDWTILHWLAGVRGFELCRTYMGEKGGRKSTWRGGKGIGVVDVAQVKL